MTLIMECLWEEDLGQGVCVCGGVVVVGRFIPQGAVILRGNGSCVTLCCVGQKRYNFSNGDQLTFQLMPCCPLQSESQHPTPPKQHSRVNSMKGHPNMETLNHAQNMCGSCGCQKTTTCLV